MPGLVITEIFYQRRRRRRRLERQFGRIINVKRITIIVSVILLVIIFLGYSYNEKENNKKHSVLGSQTTFITSIPTGSGNITNPQTWSRYVYNHTFSIAYPTGWNVIVNHDLSTVIFRTKDFCQDDDFSMPYGNSNEVTYAIFGEHDTSDMNLNNGDQFPNDSTSETMVVTNLKQLKIAGYPAVEFDYYPTDNFHFLRTRISVLKDRTMYRFDATYAQDSGKKLFEQIIKTLQFVFVKS